MPLNKAAAPQIKTGSYTGDGGATRQITVGFKCSLVIIQKSARNWFLMGGGVTAANHHYNTTPFHVERSGQGVALHATDGFIVDTDDNGANAAANGYEYWAISE